MASARKNSDHPGYTVPTMTLPNNNTPKCDTRHQQRSLLPYEITTPPHHAPSPPMTTTATLHNHPTTASRSPKEDNDNLLRVIDGKPSQPPWIEHCQMGRAAPTRHYTYTSMREAKGNTYQALRERIPPLRRATAATPVTVPVMLQ